MHKYVYPKWLEYPLFYPLTIIPHDREGFWVSISHLSFLTFLVETMQFQKHLLIFKVSFLGVTKIYPLTH